MNQTNYDIITVLGPTASGKTAFAAKLACLIDAEIISADSRQVYRRMDIGTGKDLGDYVVEGRAVPYHLIDIAEPGTKYNVFQYQHDFLAAYEAIRRRRRRVIVCGGSGLYLESILREYRLSPVPPDQELRRRLQGKSLEELTALLGTYKTLHNKTDVDTEARAIRAIEIAVHEASTPPEKRDFPHLESLTLGIGVDRDTRRARITRRLNERLKEGMVEEVRRLLKEGIAANDLIYYGLEYKYLTLYATGQLTHEEMVRQLEIAIHQFAKRQMTWFRGMERRGVTINWLTPPPATLEKMPAYIHANVPQLIPLLK